MFKIREREISFICWFMPVMFAMVETEPDYSKVPGTPLKSLKWVAGRKPGFYPGAPTLDVGILACFTTRSPHLILLLNLVFVRFICIVVHCYCPVASHYYGILCPLLCRGTLGIFQVWVIMNKAAMNIGKDAFG